MKCICIFILIAASAAFAADDREQTAGLMNGHFWTELEDNARVAFLVGIADGWRFRNSTEQQVLGKYLIAFTSNSKFTAGDLTEMVTSVYKDTENIALPIGWVAIACFAVQRGETTRDAVFLALRKHLTRMTMDTSPSDMADWNPIDVISKLKVSK